MPRLFALDKKGPTLRSCDRMALTELRVNGGDEVAVVVADHFCCCRRIEVDPTVLDGIDHPLTGR
jgi:hypothetical protein